MCVFENESACLSVCVCMCVCLCVCVCVFKKERGKTSIENFSIKNGS